MISNPYDILGVSRDASRAEIAKAVPHALKARKHPASDIAMAQKALMNPIQRMLVEFLTVRPSPVKRPKRHEIPKSVLQAEKPVFEISDEFDRVDELVNQYAIK